MADAAETTTYPDAATAISQGKRHLLVQDYTAAVTAFAEGLEMLSSKLSDCDDALGEPYLLYGRALLGLSREEEGVLGGGVPGTEEDEEIDEEDAEEDGDEERASDADEKDEPTEEAESSAKKEASTSDPAKEELKEEKSDKPSVEPSEEKPPAATNKTDDKKIEEKKMETNPESAEEKKKSEEKSGDLSVAGSSKEPHTNGSATSTTDKNCNGAAKSEEAEEDDEEASKEEDEEDPGRGIDLQVAWEVLELAKIVFVKRGEAGLKHLAETHRLLGEVAMESDNPQGAIVDLEGALKLLQKIEPCEPRAIAEIHYQLGLAHSLLNDFDASIEQFKEATTLLEGRIKQLEELKEPPAKSDDPFYSVAGEIKELKELLPAIQEKITDMKDFKEETCRLVIEGIKSKVAGGGCTNGAGTSSDGASSSSHATVSPKTTKPASDISHLVRKKRKADDTEPEAPSPCKKPTP